MSIHCVWVTVCWTGAGRVIAGRPRKQLRRRVAHQRASNLWVAGDSVVWERWQLQQVRCKGSGSINKCQSKMSRCGRRSGWDVPQRQAPMSLLLFRQTNMSVIHIAAEPLNWSDQGCYRSPHVLHSASPLAWSGVFQGPQWPAAPYGPLLWARESRNTKLILRTEGLNLPASITLKPLKNVLLSHSFPSADSCLCSTCTWTL